MDKRFLFIIICNLVTLCVVFVMYQHVDDNCGVCYLQKQAIRLHEGKDVDLKFLERGRCRQEYNMGKIKYSNCELSGYVCYVHDNLKTGEHTVKCLDKNIR